MNPRSTLPIRLVRMLAHGLGVSGALLPWALFGQFELNGLRSFELTGQDTFRSAFSFEVTGWGGGVASVNSLPTSRDFGQVISSPKPLPEEALVADAQTWLKPGFSNLALLASNISLTANTVGIACGEKHTLLLKRDGTVRAVGSLQSGQVEVPAGLSNVVAIAAGTDHNLALTSDRRVVAWGWNNAGQVGVPPDLAGVRAIAAGRNYSLALRSNGTIQAWGGVDVDYNDNEPGFDDRLEGGEMKPPFDLRYLSRNPVIAIAAGVRHALALRADGSVVGWGDKADRIAWQPPAGSGVFTAISAGSGFSVGIRRDGTVAAWGDPGYHKLEVPPNLDRVVAIACGSFHTLALRDDGTVVAWGNDAAGQASVPVGIGPIAAIAAGGFHSEILEQKGLSLTGPRLRNGLFGCELNLPAGQRYRLQASDDLKRWTTLNVDTAFPGRMSWEGALRRDSAFYRVQLIWPGDLDYVPGFLPKSPY